MIGGIIGDIVGSVYECVNHKSKDFEFFPKYGSYTDDSVLTIATADWLLNGGEAATYYEDWGNSYPAPFGGYGTGFLNWLDRAARGDFSPYNSCGNGSAMRVGPVGWAFSTLEETLRYARLSADCTHNHPEGIKGAQATALCVFLARKGEAKVRIKHEVERMFGYDLSWEIDDIRERYSWDGLDHKGNGGVCQDSVPQAISCALQAVGFEDAVRNAISIGGDSDTIGCITGSIAEALYGIPREISDKAMEYLPTGMRSVIKRFEAKYGGFLT